MKHERIPIKLDDNSSATAVAPVIVSASRSTDIPAFYIGWFMERLRQGYCTWRNPFNQATSYVSFAKTRCVVFWSKNPEPLFSHIRELEDKGVNFYVQFTLNDYIFELLEPNIPTIFSRIDTFKRLVDRLGLGRVVWRFDPLILTDTINVQKLLAKVHFVGEELKGYTEKLVFSFADTSNYKKVQCNLSKFGVKWREFTKDDINHFCAGLNYFNKKWGYELSTCGESLDLSGFGITHNKCIDPALMKRLFPDDTELMRFIASSTKDPGQRSACGCMLSKDIGAYNTCAHGCLYCYANTTPSWGRDNCISLLKQKNKEGLTL